MVDAIDRGIEARQDVIDAPRQNGLVARAPGLLRKIIERVGFADDEMPKWSGYLPSAPGRPVEPRSPRRLHWSEAVQC